MADSRVITGKPWTNIGERCRNHPKRLSLAKSGIVSCSQRCCYNVPWRTEWEIVSLYGYTLGNEHTERLTERDTDRDLEHSPSLPHKMIKRQNNKLFTYCECVPVCLCRRLYWNLYMCTRVHTCGGQSSSLGAILQAPFTLSSKTGSLIGLELSKQVRLAGQ